MRNLCKVSLSLAAVALLAAPALAQRPGTYGFGPGNLLNNKGVQEELKLTKEQKEKIDEANKKIQEKMRSASQDFQGLSREEALKKLQALAKENAEIMDKAANLTSDQKKRLAEIQLQLQVRFRGPAVFNSDENLKQLKLTDEQKDAIKMIAKEAQDKIRDETKDPGFQSFQKWMEISQKVNKEAMDKVAAKLTKDQKESWTKMLGKPFEVKIEPPPSSGWRRRPPAE
jgi:Spy/CpxP family protein refolding chaperone